MDIEKYIVTGNFGWIYIIYQKKSALNMEWLVYCALVIRLYILSMELKAIIFAINGQWTWGLNIKNIIR